MRIASLSLSFFRSYEKLELVFDEVPRQLFLGDNGSGKTNIIEAISLLSHGRSCLKATGEEMVRFGEDFFRIRVEARADDGTALTAEHVFQLSPRKAGAYFINDIKVSLLAFIGTIPSIVFLPQDLDLFTGPPSGRRNFIDTLLSQLIPAYAEIRMEYERVLKQRNALLRLIADGGAKEGDLDLWDERLTAAAAPVLEKRSDLLSAFSEALPSELRTLGEHWNDVTIKQIDSADGSMADALRKYRSRDIILQSTSVGPHRDDWRIAADGHHIAHTASRGQQRTLLLALLFVSSSLFASVRKEKPIILLDDVLSELDAHHQEALLRHLDDHQVFITSVHPVLQTGGIAVWSVAEGKIVRD